jgi:hypothetical protein
MTLGEIITSITHNRIYNIKYKEDARKSPTDFTRARKMQFEELILFMLQSLKCSTQSALRRFFTNLGKPVTMKQQSLSEARQKLTVWAFWDLYMLTVNAMTEHCTKKWHNYRVYAIDGSKISLPSEKELGEYFGKLGKDGTAPTAQGSILYDVLNDIVADAAIEPMSTCERTLALSHIEALDDIARDDKKLIIFDRGYPSFELIDELESSGLFYVMRVKTKFNLDIDAQTNTSGYVWLKKNGKRIHVRVIKFKLDSGETETLITNITDARLGKNAFKKLYFMRWPVETKYDIVKNKLQLENFNTRTVEGIQQDFFACMYLANFAASCAIDVHTVIDDTRKDKENKYQYKANMNELIGVLKDRLVLALAEDCPDKQSALVQVILDEIKGYVIPIRLDRSNPRNSSPRNSIFHHNKKANC